uniref:PilY1 beta-propeller domain-containing protein n=1 Tax=candidate division WOR-3 bacterium TaxID=2052148 RepID=A0A7C4THX6_UNCW3
MNKKNFIGLAILIGVIFTAPIYSQENPYCCAPSYVMATVKPNILICLDVTGSMQFRASRIINNGQYDSTRTYYGYFDPDSLYYYRNQEFFKYRGGALPPNSKFPFPGNIMNWMVMSRIDVARKALVGGKGLPQHSINKHTMIAEAENLGWSTSLFGWPCTLSYKKGNVTYKYQIEKPTLSEVRISKVGNWSGPDTIPRGTFRCYINVEGTADTAAGVIRQIGDKDLDCDWDEDAPRFALMFFSTEYYTHVMREFYQSDSTPNMEPYFEIFDAEPMGGTNTGNAVLQCIHYIRYCPPHNFWGSGNPPANWTYSWHGPATKWDPFYVGQGGSLQPVWCRKNFVIVIGDGEANSDTAINNDSHLPPKYFPSRPLYNYDGVWENYDDCSGWGDTDHPADDYAYYGHIQDLRPDNEAGYKLPDKQNITFYALMTFGLGSGLFREIAKDGGFIDRNNDNVPQVSEYDRDNNGIPDNYYEAETGYEIEQAMMQIILDIMSHITSSSGVAVVGVGTKYGGSTVQSQFYPRRIFPTGEVLSWTGTCQSLWLDEFGNIREDNDSPSAHRLHLQNDYVITMNWDPLQNNVMVKRFLDDNGDGKVDSSDYVGQVPIENIMPVWDAGKYLWENYNPPTNRNIWTSLNNGVHTDFSTSNAGLLRPYLGQGVTISQADTIIRYIRGEDIDTTRLRSRMVNGKPWKLGDIVNSGPSMIGRPIERYDFIYGDVSYAKYYDHYRDRRQVVYVGANDGMLHAFNSGRPVTQETPMEPIYLDPLGYDLGRELWAYIPRNVLPHLRWLKDKTYGECHIYYVDLKPYITDARIFTAESLDGIHIGGWGTLLIGGLRMGGATIRNEVDTCRSSYFLIDITDPLNPKHLWEFTDPNLAYTVCYPTVVKVKNSWFLVFGSGPMTCGGDCSQTGRIYVLDLKTGNKLHEFILPDPRSFVTNIFACDWGIDYSVDRIYFGDCWYKSTNPTGWCGKVYRILTNDDSIPSNWTLNMVMDMGLYHPVTAEGSVATDEYDHLWVYFGTGRLFSDNDELDVNPQLYVGFRDDTVHTTNPLQLYNATNVKVDTSGWVVLETGSIVSFDSLVILVNNQLGWYRQFPTPGERNLTTSLVLGGAVLFTTYCPTGDICTYGGVGNLYALYYKTGTAYTVPFLGDTLGYNRISLFLGSGIPSEPAMYVSAEQSRVFIQVGGGIVSPETGIPGLPRRGVILWKLK